MSQHVEVTEALTQQVANLARLELSPEEVRTFTGQIRDVLQYVETLQSIDISGVEPLYHPLEQAAYLREDVAVEVPRDSEGRPKVLESAPDVLNDGYKVPPIL